MFKHADTPAKIIFMNIPAQGHINPTLPVVAELVRRKIKVIYYDTEEFRASIEPIGAEFQAYPPPVPSAAEVSAAVDRSVINFSAQLFKMTEHLTEFMLEEVRREQPDIVIHDASCLWGMLVARLTGVAAVSSFPTFVLDNKALNLNLHDYRYLLVGGWAKLPRVMASRFRLQWQYGANIMPRGSIFPVRGGLNIVYTARELQPDTALIDHTFRFVGPSIDPATRPTDFPFEQLKRHPLVYILFGTVHMMDKGFYQACFEAFADFPGQVILSVGRQMAIEAVGPAPSNFIVRNSVPQLEILRRCDVFVTHAGMNSVQEALYFGVSMVLVPYQFEQLVNARVVAAAGVGMIANEKPPYGKAVSMQTLRALTERVLQDAAMKRAAQTVGEALRSTGGYQQAADAICNFWQQTQQAAGPILQPAVH